MTDAPLKKAVRAAPAVDAARDPLNDLLTGKIECADSRFDGFRQAARVVLGIDIGASSVVAIVTKR